MKQAEEEVESKAIVSCGTVFQNSVYMKSLSHIFQEAILKNLRALDPDKSNIVRWSDSFLHIGHVLSGAPSAGYEPP